ncbi:MAG: YkgJ family cysteine cluster protein [Candidatus Binatia bacterium]
MEHEPQNAPEMVTANIKLAGPDWEMQTAISVPKGPTSSRQLLPVAQAFADKVVDAAIQASESQGAKISCKKGCGACCRQLVPIAETEAHHIRDVITALPEPRRTEIRARFSAAQRKLADAGLLEKLQEPSRQWEAGESVTFGLTYFAQGIPCPFLEDGACSIYADRPIACREYLVTSPAENCAEPTAQTVQTIPLPLKIWTAVARFDEVPVDAHFIRWVPLILAPEWADTHPQETPARPGPELLQELFDNMQKTGSALTRPGEQETENL